MVKASDMKKLALEHYENDKLYNYFTTYIDNVIECNAKRGNTNCYIRVHLDENGIHLCRIDGNLVDDFNVDDLRRLSDEDTFYNLFLRIKRSYSDDGFYLDDTEIYPHALDAQFKINWENV